MTARDKDTCNALQSYICMHLVSCKFVYMVKINSAITFLKDMYVENRGFGADNKCRRPNELNICHLYICIYVLYEYIHMYMVYSYTSEQTTAHCQSGYNRIV